MLAASSGATFVGAAGRSAPGSPLAEVADQMVRRFAKGVCGREAFGLKSFLPIQRREVCTKHEG